MLNTEIQGLPKQISPNRFERLAKDQNLTETTFRRARMVLVDGESIRDVAALEGVSEDAIRKMVRRVAGSIQEQHRLTESHFTRVMEQMPRVSPRNRQLAYRVLVEGESRSEVANEAGISLSTMDKLLARIRSRAIPEGWRMVTVVLPEECAEGVERMEEAAFEDYMGLNQEGDK
jgi:transposase